MFRNLANIGQMVNYARKMGGHLREVNDKLRTERVTGTAGGGLVEVEMNGLCEMLSLRIDPQLVARQDAEMLEDLLRAAVNQAVLRSKEVHASHLQALTGGLDLPGLNEALAKFPDTAE